MRIDNRKRFGFLPDSCLVVVYRDVQRGATDRKDQGVFISGHIDILASFDVGPDHPNIGADTLEPVKDPFGATIVFIKRDDIPLRFFRNRFRGRLVRTGNPRVRPDPVR